MSASTHASPSTAVADGAGMAEPSRHASPPGRSVIVEEFIAQVLHRAHHTAQASDAVDEARTVLHLAHLFADELADISRRFDRVRFIQAVTGESV